VAFQATTQGSSRLHRQRLGQHRGTLASHRRRRRRPTCHPERPLAQPPARRRSRLPRAACATTAPTGRIPPPCRTLGRRQRPSSRRTHRVLSCCVRRSARRSRAPPSTPNYSGGVGGCRRARRSWLLRAAPSLCLLRLHADESPAVRGAPSRAASQRSSHGFGRRARDGARRPRPVSCARRSRWSRPPLTWTQWPVRARSWRIGLREPGGRSLRTGVLAYAAGGEGARCGWRTALTCACAGGVKAVVGGCWTKGGGVYVRPGCEV